MSMIVQLLWIEMAIKASVGVVLVLFPRTLARIFGLPTVTETFWPRLFGATLLGLAAATFLEDHLAAKNGLGLSGHIAINMAAVLAIFAMLIMGKVGGARRGRILLGLMAGALTVLALVELAWA
ncbi:MAG: hypothetical protein R3D67_13745 [Hyphomicrobiaceae bacterium]